MVSFRVALIVAEIVTIIASGLQMNINTKDTIIFKEVHAILYENSIPLTY